MENIVEEVEDKSQTEGSPANSQRYEDMGRCEVVSSSLSVKHCDTRSSLHQSHRCQAMRDILHLKLFELFRLA